MLVILRLTSKRTNATALMEINDCADMVAHGVSARRPHKLATAYLDCRKAATALAWQALNVCATVVITGALLPVPFSKTSI